MSDDLAVRLRGVSKKYHLYESLKHRVYEALHPLKRKYHREFWALHEINLEIPKGSTVGILGVNGSGKSTLLQIVSGILQPTAGTVDVCGKVAALIELGAGFNPELTGRENAEINCTILGLDSTSMRKRMPEIEAFADIGEFFDQPVKTYSSGMFMRVAFATAISVDPDILVIDEALAVGDARFQEKCFRKFRDFQAQGKTILLVTHDRFAVPRLCNRGILLHQGRLLRHGNPLDVVNAYAEILALKDATGVITPLRNPKVMPEAGAFAEQNNIKPGLEQTPTGEKADLENAVDAFISSGNEIDLCPQNPTYNKNEHRYGDRRALVIDYLIACDGRINPRSIPSKSRLTLFMRVKFAEQMSSLNYGLSVTTKDGLLLFGNNTHQQGLSLEAGMPGEIRVYRMSLNMSLAPGDAFLTFGVAESPGKLCDIRQACAHIEITDRRSYVGIVPLEVEFGEESRLNAGS